MNSTDKSALNRVEQEIKWLREDIATANADGDYNHAEELNQELVHLREYASALNRAFA